MKNTTKQKDNTIWASWEANGPFCNAVSTYKDCAHLINLFQFVQLRGFSLLLFFQYINLSVLFGMRIYSTSLWLMCFIFVSWRVCSFSIFTGPDFWWARVNVRTLTHAHTKFNLRCIYKHKHLTHSPLKNAFTLFHKVNIYLLAIFVYNWSYISSPVGILLLRWRICCFIFSCLFAFSIIFSCLRLQFCLYFNEKCYYYFFQKLHPKREREREKGRTVSIEMLLRCLSTQKKRISWIIFSVEISDFVVHCFPSFSKIEKREQLNWIEWIETCSSIPKYHICNMVCGMVWHAVPCDPIRWAAAAATAATAITQRNDHALAKQQSI